MEGQPGKYRSGQLRREPAEQKAERIIKEELQSLG
jgi:hypothetical protein